MEKLNGKVALITGSSRGIGKAIALAFAKERANVVVCYNSRIDEAQKVKDEIDSIGCQAMVVHLPVTDRDIINQSINVVVKKFGKIDILVNNAGINKPNDFDKITDKDWEELIGVNLTGVFKVSQECLPFMNNGGNIINISSVSGQYGGPRTTHYAVSKGGLITLTHNMAIFCAAKGIRVNAVSPGLIESEMAGAANNLGLGERILLKRIGKPEEVANVVVFLASDEASYITAQTINVNGGLYF
ncbi:MAG: SDR family NAD(P)-dependent oxidoreductase [Candidatus Anammoxibacter sp.]